MATSPKARSANGPKKLRLTQAERVALSDQRMFESACRLIAERGSQNTTLREIGELAGYSRGLASNRFGSKEALFAELISFLNQQWLDDLHHFVGGRSGLAAFCAALEAVEDFLTEQPAHVRAMYLLWYETLGSHSDVRSRLAGQHERQRTDVQRWIEQGISEGHVKSNVSPARFSVQYCSFIFGTIYQWLVNPAAIDLRATFADFRTSTLSQIIREDAQMTPKLLRRKTVLRRRVEV